MRPRAGKRRQQQRRRQPQRRSEVPMATDMGTLHRRQVLLATVATVATVATPRRRRSAVATPLEHGAEIPDLKAAKQVMQLMQKAYRHEVTP